MESAILFLVFNRPLITEQTFAVIQKLKPSRLYISADGPRLETLSDNELCKKVREIVLRVNWPCKLKTLFQKENLGPMSSQINSLDWFFSHEEEGIILEDDCKADLSFFAFCDKLLKYYRSDDRIFMISGNNFQRGIKRGSADYYFSIYTHIWGWATWKRSWKKFNKDIIDWPLFNRAGGLEALHHNNDAIKYWRDLFNKIYSRNYDRGWDYRFLFACWKENSLAIVPNINLVSNIGFDSTATNCHDKYSSNANINVGEIKGVIRHPKVIQRHLQADEYTSKKHFSKPTLWRRLYHCLFNPRRTVEKIISKLKEIK